MSSEFVMIEARNVAHFNPLNVVRKLDPGLTEITKQIAASMVIDRRWNAEHAAVLFNLGEATFLTDDQKSEFVRGEMTFREAQMKAAKDASNWALVGVLQKRFCPEGSEELLPLTPVDLYVPSSGNQRVGKAAIEAAVELASLKPEPLEFDHRIPAFIRSYGSMRELIAAETKSNSDATRFNPMSFIDKMWTMLQLDVCNIPRPELFGHLGYTKESGSAGQSTMAAHAAAFIQKMFDVDILGGLLKKTADPGAITVKVLAADSKVPDSARNVLLYVSPHYLRENANQLKDDMQPHNKVALKFLHDNDKPYWGLEDVKQWFNRITKSGQEGVKKAAEDKTDINGRLSLMVDSNPNNAVKDLLKAVTTGNVESLQVFADEAKTFAEVDNINRKLSRDPAIKEEFAALMQVLVGAFDAGMLLVSTIANIRDQIVKLAQPPVVTSTEAPQPGPVDASSPVDSNDAAAEVAASEAILSPQETIEAAAATMPESEPEQSGKGKKGKK